jgi:hypothetical protein
LVWIKQNDTRKKVVTDSGLCLAIKREIEKQHSIRRMKMEAYLQKIAADAADQSLPGAVETTPRKGSKTPTTVTTPRKEKEKGSAPPAQLQISGSKASEPIKPPTPRKQSLQPLPKVAPLNNMKMENKPDTSSPVGKAIVKQPAKEEVEEEIEEVFEPDWENEETNSNTTKPPDPVVTQSEIDKKEEERKRLQEGIKQKCFLALILHRSATF